MFRGSVLGVFQDSFSIDVLPAACTETHRSFSYAFVARLFTAVKLSCERCHAWHLGLGLDASTLPSFDTEPLSLQERLGRMVLPLGSRLGKAAEGSSYVVSPDNFVKMVWIALRVESKVPVVIMGETGCGKTSLIRHLARLLSVDFRLPQHPCRHFLRGDCPVCSRLCAAEQ